MVPQYFIFMEKIPLTPNGKVDRRALPAPEMKPGEDFIAPRNEVEEKLVEIWSNVLGLGKDIIGIDSNFFQLGGHSLKATLLVVKIHKAFNVKIPIAKLFENPTVREIASLIDIIGWAGEKIETEKIKLTVETEEIIL